MNRLVFAAGATSLAAQTLLFRELLVAFHGNELGTGVFFATWLAWVALGAALATRLRPPRDEAVLSWLLLGTLPAIGLQVGAFAGLRTLAGVPPSEVFPLERLAVLALVLNAPTSLLVGLLFALAARVRRASGLLYAWEAAGCFVGGAGFTLAVHLGLAPLGAMGFFFVLAGLAALGRRTAPAAVAAVLVGAALLAGGGRALARHLAAAQVDALLPGARLDLATDTPQGRMVLARTRDDLVVVRDGEVAGVYPDTEAPALEAALLMAELGPGPSRSAVVLGDHAEETVRALLRYDAVQRVTLVVSDRRVQGAVEGWLPQQTRAALADPRVEVVAADARAWLTRAPAGSADLVLVEGAEPTTAAANRLHTRELALAAARVLTTDGLLVLRLAAGANYMGAELALQGASALATLESVFPRVVVLPGDPASFLAGRQGAAPTTDPALLARRHAALATTSPVPDTAFASLVDTTRLAFVDELYRRPDPTGGSLVNRDTRPVSFTLALLAQGRFAGSAWVRTLQGARAAGAWLFWVPLVVVAALRFHRHLALAPAAHPAWPERWVLGATGFASMGLSVVLLFAFQARVGTLFGQVGLLGAVLLAGTAAGAAGGRALARRTAGWPYLPHLALLSVAGLALGLPQILVLLDQGPAARLPLLGLAAATGLLTGAAFPLATTLSRDRADLGGDLFAADHVGGALGALAVGVLVLPVAGTAGACGLVAGAAALVVVLLVARTLADRAPGQRWVRYRQGLRLRPGMAWPDLGTALAAVTLSSVVVGMVAARRLDIPKTTFDRAELSVLAVSLAAPTGLVYEERAEPFVHYVGRVDGRAAHALAASMALTDEIRGYAGPINLLVAVDDAGTLRQARILASDETPAYVRDVVPWLEGLVGRDLRQPLALRGEGGDVDVVTGATISARAALDTVRLTGARLARDALGVEGVGKPQASPGRRWDRGATFLLLALPGAVLVLLRGSRDARLAFLLVAATAGGAWLNVQASLETLAGPLHGRLPASPTSLLLLGGLLLLTVAFGAAWCGTLCPFGAALEWLGRLGMSQQVTPTADRLGRQVKHVVLALALTGFALTGERAFLSFDPLARAFRADSWTEPGWPLAVAALAVGLSLVWHRAWCRYLCPLGALVALGNRAALLRRLVPTRRYGHCDLGVEGPMDLNCLQCNRCVAAKTPLAPGPVVPPIRRADGATGQGGRWLALALALAVLAMAGAVSDGLGGTEDTGLSTVHDVDLDKLRRLVDEGRLSDHEARHYKPVE